MNDPIPDGDPVAVIEFRDIDMIAGTFNVAVRYDPPLKELGEEGRFAGTPAQITCANEYQALVDRVMGSEPEEAEVTDAD